MFITILLTFVTFLLASTVDQKLADFKAKIAEWSATALSSKSVPIKDVVEYYANYSGDVDDELFSKLTDFLVRYTLVRYMLAFRSQSKLVLFAIRDIVKGIPMDFKEAADLYASLYFLQKNASTKQHLFELMRVFDEYRILWNNKNGEEMKLFVDLSKWFLHRLAKESVPDASREEVDALFHDAYEHGDAVMKDVAMAYFLVAMERDGQVSPIDAKDNAEYTKAVRAILNKRAAKKKSEEEKDEEEEDDAEVIKEMNLGNNANPADKKARINQADDPNTTPSGKGRKNPPKNNNKNFSRTHENTQKPKNLPDKPPKVPTKPVVPTKNSPTNGKPPNGTSASKTVNKDDDDTKIEKPKKSFGQIARNPLFIGGVSLSLLAIGGVVFWYLTM
jgi:hypothetical protein